MTADMSELLRLDQILKATTERANAEIASAARARAAELRRLNAAGVSYARLAAALGISAHAAEKAAKRGTARAYK